MALESLVDVEQSKHELSAQGELKVSELPLTPPQDCVHGVGGHAVLWQMAGCACWGEGGDSEVPRCCGESWEFEVEGGWGCAPCVLPACSPCSPSTWARGHLTTLLHLCTHPDCVPSPKQARLCSGSRAFCPHRARRWFQQLLTAVR